MPLFKIQRLKIFLKSKTHKWDIWYDWVSTAHREMEDQDNRTTDGCLEWIPAYFLHFVPVGLCPVLDGLLLLLCGTQLLFQPLQLLQQGWHLVAFVLGVLLCPTQPAQLITHSLTLHGVGTLQADELIVDQPVFFSLEVQDKGTTTKKELTNKKNTYDKIRGVAQNVTCSSIFLCSCMILFSMPLLSFLKCSTERASIFSFFNSCLALILRMQHCR